MVRPPSLRLLKQVSELLAARKIPKPWRCLSLSYQDVVVPRDVFVEILGDEALEIPVRRDSPQIVSWHKCEHVTTTIPDWHEVLRYLGFEPSSTDIVKARGCEEFLDLNMPLSPRFLGGKFHLVIDNVAQHCFDIGQAIRNIVRLPAVGGYAMHITPLAMVNHGFWTMSPTLFTDVYSANGYEIVEHVWHELPRDASPCPSFPVDPTWRMRPESPNCVQVIVARRDRIVNPFVVPTQAKFVLHPNSVP